MNNCVELVFNVILYKEFWIRFDRLFLLGGGVQTLGFPGPLPPPGGGAWEGGGTPFWGGPPPGSKETLGLRVGTGITMERLTKDCCWICWIIM